MKSFDIILLFDNLHFTQSVPETCKHDLYFENIHDVSIDKFKVIPNQLKLISWNFKQYLNIQTCIVW